MTGPGRPGHRQARDNAGRFAEQQHERADIHLGPHPRSEAAEAAERIQGGLAAATRFGPVEMRGESSPLEVAVVQAAVDRLWSTTPARSPLDGVLFAPT